MTPDHPPATALEILDFEPRYREFFKTLNLDWIERYFTVEAPDRKALENPEEYVLAPGGRIFFARYDGAIAGTCALIRQGDGVYELAKMAVSPHYQGKQIGQALCLHALEQARLAGARRVYLETNSRLEAALALYRKVGFRQVPLDTGDSPYQRVDVKMVIDFGEPSRG